MYNTSCTLCKNFICTCGGTGRRARLRIWSRKGCRFDSCQVHQTKAVRFRTAFLAPRNSNLPQVRCTRPLHSRPTSLSLRDISPIRRITCQVHQTKAVRFRTAFLAPRNSNLPQVRCTRPLHSRPTSLSLRDISPIRRITCQVHQTPP